MPATYLYLATLITAYFTHTPFYATVLPMTLQLHHYYPLFFQFGHGLYSLSDMCVL